MIKKHKFSTVLLDSTFEISKIHLIFHLPVNHISFSMQEQTIILLEILIEILLEILLDPKF